MGRMKSVTLECSLKPFFDVTDKGIDETCLRLLETWRRLIEQADCVHILLWVGEGNEIYEWRGNYDDELIWAQSIGFCNYHHGLDMYDMDNRHYSINVAQPYHDNPPIICFSHLKRIIEKLKEFGQAHYGKTVRIGATIDPGPEFAESRFKVDLHPEVLTPDQRIKQPKMMHFMTHQASLHADDTQYAAYPKGFAEGLSFGTFLGAQFREAVNDLGYDYIWFSNGFAYSHFTWGFRGEVFAGEGFSSAVAKQELAKLEKFWTDFTTAYPSADIEVRGTNFSVGMDIATDGASHDAVVKLGGITAPPCNPPWGSRALGLEMCSFLSRIAKPSTEDILFRFYLNDPWFECNAWYDAYNREPFDVYAPMSAARVNTDASLSTPNRLAILTVDTQHGELVQDEANDIIPHFNRAFQEQTDEAGPIIWVYPHDEYHSDLHGAADKLHKPFFQDWFMVQAMNAGAPINTVMSTDVFSELQGKDALPDAVFIMPVPDRSWPVNSAVLAAIDDGRDMFFYGSMKDADPQLHKKLGLTLDEELDGAFTVENRLSLDIFKQETRKPTSQDAFAESVGMDNNTDLHECAAEDRRLLHRASICDGGLQVSSCRASDIRISVQQGDQQRVYALSHLADSGSRIAWIRGTLHFDPLINNLEPLYDQPWMHVISDDWCRRMFAEFSWDIQQERLDQAQKPAYIFIKRHKGAFVFTGHKPNTTTGMWFKTPHGAPIFPNNETEIRGNYAGERFGKTIYNEVRAFVSMADGVVTYTELPIPKGYERHMCIGNLQQSDVKLFIHPDKLADRHYTITNKIKGDVVVEHSVDLSTGSIDVKNHTGAIYLMW
ncbi:MAG: hypothetical protein HRU15_13680 [Planctomycetes bacterium]|nr:hypothetical protein [Planctomycetota bacterium]